MATKKEDCIWNKFFKNLDPKYNDKREKMMLHFLMPILNPKKPYNVTLTLANTLLIAYSKKKVVDLGSIIGELVH
jgi:hypothetical protein